MLTRREVNESYLQQIFEAKKTGELPGLFRGLAKRDLFFLITNVFARADVDREWLYERCTEVQQNPDGYLDLWFREGYKSTIITYGLTIQDILNDPDITVGIFSYNRPTAKAFLRQIKREFEMNELLKSLFPDVLWANPSSEAPKWSEDEGIVVRRKVNSKEGTVEAWGLVDGQPTGRHFKRMIYDDVVTLESVTTPEMCQKTIRAWEMSRNLTAEGGKTRYIGTRYSYNDAYGEMMRREVVKPRIYPVFDKENQPVLLTRERIEEKRKELGPYVFCFPGETPILMADWSEKPIWDIKPGEYVVGYSFPEGKGNKSKLVKSLVKSIGWRTSPVIQATLASGRIVRCTPDHKWYTGRRGTDIGGIDGHKAYLPIITPSSKNRIRSLISVYDPREIQKKYDAKTAGWLAGIFDGEGAVSGGCIHIHQSQAHNPIVCDAIRSALRTLDFDFGEFAKNRDNNGTVIDFYLRGGRQEKIRFLNICRPVRSHKIIDFLFEQGTRDFGKSQMDKVVSVEQIPEQRVYNIETETGNYIAWGYATKNSSQMLQNPVADEAQNFKEEWLQTWPVATTTNLKIYILVDPASKKKKNSDYTAMMVIGLGVDRNYYIIDMIRDRLNLTERTQTLFGLHKMYKPVAVGYEEYGMQSDVEHLMYVQAQENYRFPIYPLGGNVGKEDRIRALVPIFEQKRVFLPQMCIRTLSNGKTVDLTKVFIEEEYKTFPVGAHDDSLDCLARIITHDKKGIFAVFPTEAEKREIRRPPDINEVARLERIDIWEQVKEEYEREQASYDW